MSLRPFLLWLLIVPLSAAITGEAAWVPSIKLPLGETPVELVRYALSVQVRGLYAACSASMVFRNPNARMLEGELEFPLPGQATVSGYALDLNGQLVEGVVVGKDQARVVLEAERRQRIDPGLVEQVRGNLFRTRIYPVPAQGQRMVVVTWVQELALKGGEAALRLALPRCPLPEFALHVEIAAGGSEPALTGFGNLALTSWRDQRTADATLRDVTPDDDLLVRLQRLPDQLVQVEEHAGERFVAISDLPGRSAQAARPPLPRRIAVAWDASASRSPDAIARSREFLRSWFARCPGCGVDLVVFRDVPEPPQAFADGASLLAALDHLAYDGGTGLARLDLRQGALPHPDDRCWVLLSDGLGTVGDGLPANGDVPVFCPLADRECDASFLRLLAVRSGGALLDLIGGDPAAAVDAILAPPLALMRVEALPGVLGDLQTSSRGGRATVLARLLGDGAVQLVYGSAHQEGARTTIRIAAGAPASGSVLARAWAGARAADLGVFAEANRSELVALGQRYHLVTPGTSLIVLESLEQYLRHRIEPPESLAGMREQYQRSLKQRAVAWVEDEGQHRERVVGWWRQRVAWWKPGAQVELAQNPAAVIAAPDDLTRTQVQAIIRSAVTGVPPAAAAAPATAAAAAAAEGMPTAASVVLLSPAAPAATSSPAAIAKVTGTSALEDRQQALKSAGGTTAAGAAMASGESDGAGGASAGRRHGGEEDASGSRSSGISITPFDPATPYLRALTQSPADQAYATYLGLTASWRTSPSFYLDCAGFFLARDAALGRRVLSNLAEMRIDDPALLRIFSWRLQEAGDLDLAVSVLRRVLSLRPEEPQSYRDLALALSARGEARGLGDDLSEAMGLLYRVVMRHPLEESDLGERADLVQVWERFPQIEIIALEELNRLLAVSAQRSWDHPPVAPPLDERLRGNLDCDLRVVMSWDADATDIDLHVVEPSGEEAYYARQNTRIGGLVSSDMTQGYGPEEYLIHRAPAGTYAIRCHYYAARMQTLLGPATVSAVAITDWGRASERRQRLTLRLDRSGEFHSIGTITLGAGSPSGSQPSNGVITRDQLQQLAVGQRRAEVEARLGTPLRVDGEGVTVLVYAMANGAISRLGFGPDLLWAREVLAGAERDLLPR